MRRTLDEIFTKPVELYRPETEAERSAAIADVFEPKPKRPLSDILGKEPEEKSGFQSFIDAGGRTLTKRGIGIIQLLDEATGGALLSPEAREASYKKTKQIREENAADDSISGAIGGITSDPLNALPFKTGAKGLAAVGNIIGSSAITGGISEGLDAVASDDENRLANLGEGGAISALLSPLVAGTGKLAVGTAKVVGGPLQTLGKALAVSPEKIAQIEAAGLDPSLAAASDNDLAKAAYNTVSMLPGGSGKIRDTNKAANDAIMDELKGLGYTGTQTPTMAGETITGALERFQETGKNRFKRVDDYLNKIVAPTDTFDTFQLAKRLDEVTNKPGLTPKQVEDLQGSKSVQEVMDILAQGKEAPYAALKRARQVLGNTMKEPHIVGNTESGIAKQLYGALSETIKDGIAKTGNTKAARAFELRNKLYTDFIDENQAIAQKLLGKANPEQIYQSLVSGTKIGGTTADRVMSKLNSVEKDMVRDAIIYQQGGADNFTPLGWFSKYDKMSPEAKKAFFKGKEDLFESHERLAKAVKNFNDIKGFENTSRSGWINGLNKILTGTGVGAAALGFSTMATGIAGGLGLSRLTAEGLTNPKFAKALAAAVEAAAENKKNPPKGAINVIGRYLSSKGPEAAAKITAINAPDLLE